MTAQTLIAIDADALEGLRHEMRRINARLDAVEMTPAPAWVTLDEYAVKVGKSKRTIRNWKDAGLIDTKLEGTVTMVRVSPDV